MSATYSLDAPLNRKIEGSNDKIKWEEFDQTHIVKNFDIDINFLLIREDVMNLIRLI